MDEASPLSTQLLPPPATPTPLILLHSTRYEVIFVGAGLMSGALQQMARFSDKRLSLTDCASFETMNRLGLSSAFSLDPHFRECGFEMEP